MIRLSVCSYFGSCIESCYRILLVFFGLGYSGLLAAESVSSPAIVPTVSQARPVVEPLNTGSVVQMLAGLLLVIGLIFLLAWLLKRFTGISGQHRSLQVVASLSLSAREKLVLVQAGDKQLLLGVAPGRVNLLQSYDQPLIEPGVAMGEFANKLQQALSRKGTE
ncbi:flagellar biosynthetic protein FliO [Amphritea japonica]|uniref:Flagellar protein n=1 Tax=Amphritea japonica ATCC BAA-1530 TaxID=1278309 RepID=A0A7R6P3G1_9GAMM|nr:flagellar biosynthetic protein FliO [Amphritea japonica]BBB25179.1 flagellar protein FliO/FliZ [Amphritea japonica ATCC BAA-1530]